MQEREIVEAAIQHLQQLTGIEIKEVAPSAHRSKSHRQPDTAVEMETTGKRFFFWVEVKNELRQLHLAHLIDSLGQDAENWMLICQYLSKSNRAQLKKENINYLDASGNCHIRKGTLFLFINDQKVSAQRQANTSKLWKPAGVRLVFAVLLNPGFRSAAQPRTAQPALPHHCFAKQIRFGNSRCFIAGTGERKILYRLQRHLPHRKP